MSMKESILNGIAKDCYNMGASIGADKDLILVNYLDFDKEATLSPFNRQLNDDFGNKGGLTDIILKEGSEFYTFEGTDYSVIPTVSTEIKENGNAWYSHSIAFTVYNKTSYARETLLMLGKSRVVAITRDRSTGLFEVFGAEQGLKLSGLDRAYTGAQSSNFYTVTIATPDIAVIREKSLGELSLKFNGESGSGSIPPDNNNLEYLLSLKEDKANKGIANGYSPLDSNAKVPAINLSIVNDLTTGGISSLLSAEQGKLINDRITSGLNNIRSERVIVLEEPITRLTASQAINDLPSFEINDYEIPYFVTTNIEGEAGYKIELIGLGKGIYGSGGTAISASEVRISGLIDNGALGLNQILGLGNTGTNKSIILNDSIDPNVYTSASKFGYEVKNNNNITSLLSESLKFDNSTSFGTALLRAPLRIIQENTINYLPTVDGVLTLSVNGVFADETGNITLSPTGGAIPSWQQTLNVTNADVLVPFMKVSNNVNESSFGLSASGVGADPVAFKIETPRKILLETGLNGKIELGNDLGILIDGKDKKVEIISDNIEGLFLDSGENGGISFEFNTGITLDARTQGLTLLGQAKGITIDSGLSMTIGGGLMTVNSLSSFTQKVTLKNSTGLTLNTNVGNFESSIKSDNVTKAGLIFQLPDPVLGTYTLATTADFSTPNLNAVLGVGGTATDKTITLNSVSDANTIFENGFDGFTLTNTVSGNTKKSTLSIDSFAYEDSLTGRKQTIDSMGFYTQKDSNATFSKLTPEGLFLQQNVSIPSLFLNLRGTHVSGTSKIIELPNVNGFLTASVNGVVPDSNGNIILSVAGTQNLTQVLTQGDDAGGLNIQNVTDLELIDTLTFNNGTATSIFKQKVGSVISGNLIIPEKTGNNIIPLSINSLFPNDAGEIVLPINNFTNGEELPVTVTPPTAHYTPVDTTLKGHLQGIDQALGTVVQTTAGITNRIYFTGVPVTISAGTFYTSSASGKGAVASVQQNLTNNDNQKQYFTQDVISIAQPLLTTAPAGTFTGQLSVQVDATIAQQRFTVEAYKTDVDGNPIPSGIIGAPTGDLGVTVIAILDSGLVELTADILTNITISGQLASTLTLNVNERVRYHVSAEKVGTSGGNIVMSVFYGSNHNSYYDTPVTPTTDTVLNRSLVSGVTSSDALNTLNSGKANLNSPIFTGSPEVPTPTTSNGAVNKSYADSLVVGLLDDRGNYNPSTNSNLYPTTGGSGTSGAVLKGDLWSISGLGTGVSALIGAKTVTDGDVIRALVDTPSNTDTNWAIVENNFGYVAENSANKTSTVVGNEASTTLYLNIAGAYAYFQQKLTDSIFGSFIASLTSKTTPVDADSISISDSADSNKQKKVSLTNFKSFLKTYFDNQYAIHQVTITTSVSITTATLSDNSFTQLGKHVLIKNGVNNINITVDGVGLFPTTYQKEGIGTITFVQGSGRTLRQVDGTSILNGAVGSTASISSDGTTDSLRISNA